MSKQPVLVVVGPTASGKSEFSLELAELLSAEIISADSMQVYRGMDIGTAKPSPQERKRVKHHLLDVVDPDQPFNVADYVVFAEKVLADLDKKRIPPLLTGGTGLYIDALLDGFLFPDSQADPCLRAKLLKQAEEDPKALFRQLEAVDPQSAARIHPNDLRRIVRALEVYQRTGQAISVLQQKLPGSARPYAPLFIGLNCPRDQLYARINSRVDKMVGAGLIQEVERLRALYPQQPTALQALGYKEIGWFLEREMPLEKALEILKRDTRRYAKRQLSWFRRNKRIHWVEFRTEKKKELAKKIGQMWQAAL